MSNLVEGSARHRLISGLREFAQFMEEHPEIPATTNDLYICIGVPGWRRLLDAARAFRKVSKRALAWPGVQRKFGHLRVEVFNNALPYREGEQTIPRCIHELAKAEEMAERLVGQSVNEEVLF